MSWIKDTFFGGNEKKAGETSARASEAALAEQRRQFDIATGLVQPAIGAGNEAREQLMRLLGLSVPQQTQGTGAVNQPVPDFQRTSGGMYGGVRDLINYRRDVQGGSSGSRAVFPDSVIPKSFGGMYGLDSDTSVPSRGGYPTGGTTGGTASADPMDIIRNTPGYQFQLEQGARALNAQRSAGGSSGGELMKDFARFNQGTASNFYMQYANQLSALAGSAQTASSTLAGQGISAGQQFANSIQNAGDARASGLIGKSNAAKGTVTDIFGLFGGGGFSNPFGGGGTNPGGAGNSGGFGFPSDIRLKENIKHVRDDGSLRIYSWDWNEKAKEMGITAPTIGVIAQEVMETHPDAVSEVDGYYVVDYGKLQ